MKAFFKKHKYVFALVGLLTLTGSGVMYQAVRHDNTLTGEGITGSELKVDTTKIATPYDLIAGRAPTALTPPIITAHQDNYNPTGWDDATVVRLEVNELWMISSFAAPTTSIKPQTKTLLNVGSRYPVLLIQEHPDGTAANRIAAIGGMSFKLWAGNSIVIYYDATSSRWRLVDAITEPIARYTNYYKADLGSTTAGDQAGVSTAVGGGTVTSTASTATIPALWVLSTGAAATNNATVYAPKTTMLTHAAFGAAHIFVECEFQIPVLSTALQTYTIEVQICPTATTNTLEFNNSVAIRYSHGINAGEFELFSQDNAGAESVADLNVVVAVNTVYKLRIEIDKDKTEARAYINGLYVGRVTSNLPNSVVTGARLIHFKSVGTTPVLCNMQGFSTGSYWP